jgi:hypothetical protein
MRKKIAFYFFCLMYLIQASGQNQNSKWYFGNFAVLDFLTSPPTVLSASSLQSYEGCASVADSTGNLLFYTRGDVVWNRQHVIMANGTGLLGHVSASQSSMIVKQPGTPDKYFLFTLDQYGNANGLRYSVIDMNLAAGDGSVTTKNILLATPCTEKMTATKHCNGIDSWVVVHAWNSRDFKSFLVTANGVNPTPIISTAGILHDTYIGSGALPGENGVGCMKISPNGKKLALAVQWKDTIQLFDFDNVTGSVTNPVTLPAALGHAYGVEFSASSGKLYVSGIQSGSLVQWDLCAGNNAAVINSKVVLNTTNIHKGTLQLANDRKIYVAQDGSTMLGIIHSPDSAGSACNFVENAQSLGTSINYFGLPNFDNSVYRPKAPLFQASVIPPGCGVVTFTSPAFCSPQNPILSQSWDFGDPSSGSANTSFLANPTHTFSNSGIYTVKLFLNFNCYTDTLIQALSINKTPPVLSVSGRTNICAGETTTLIAVGANSYQWNNNATTAQVTVSPTNSAVFIVTGTSNTNACSSVKSISVNVSPCLQVNTTLKNEGIVIYPNPAKDEITITTKPGDEIIISDQLGKILYHNELCSLQETLHLNLAPGLYFLKLIRAGESKVFKIVVG